MTDELLIYYDHKNCRRRKNQRKRNNNVRYMYVSAATILSLLLYCHDDGLISSQHQQPIESSSILFISAFHTTTTPTIIPSSSVSTLSYKHLYISFRHQMCPSTYSSSGSSGGLGGKTLWHRNNRPSTSSLASSFFNNNDRFDNANPFGTPSKIDEIRRNSGIPTPGGGGGGGPRRRPPTRSSYQNRRPYNPSMMFFADRNKNRHYDTWSPSMMVAGEQLRDRVGGSYWNGFNDNFNNNFWNDRRGNDDPRRKRKKKKKKFEISSIFPKFKKNYRPPKFFENEFIRKYYSNIIPKYVNPAIDPRPRLYEQEEEKKRRRPSPHYSQFAKWFYSIDRSNGLQNMRLMIPGLYNGSNSMLRMRRRNFYSRPTGIPQIDTWIGNTDIQPDMKVMIGSALATLAASNYAHGLSKAFVLDPYATLFCCAMASYLSTTNSMLGEVSRIGGNFAWYGCIQTVINFIVTVLQYPTNNFYYPPLVSIEPKRRNYNDELMFYAVKNEEQKQLDPYQERPVLPEPIGILEQEKQSMRLLEEQQLKQIRDEQKFLEKESRAMNRFMKEQEKMFEKESKQKIASYELFKEREEKQYEREQKEFEKMAKREQKEFDKIVKREEREMEKRMRDEARERTKMDKEVFGDDERNFRLEEQRMRLRDLEEQRQEEYFNEKRDRELKRQRLQKSVTPPWDDAKRFSTSPGYGRNIDRQTNSGLGNYESNRIYGSNGNFNRNGRDYINDDYYDDRNRQDYDSYPSYDVEPSRVESVYQPASYRDENGRTPRGSSPYSRPYESPTLPISSYANSNRQSIPYSSSASIGMSSRPPNRSFSMPGSSYSNDPYERRGDIRRDTYLDPRDENGYNRNRYGPKSASSDVSGSHYEGRGGPYPSSSFPSAYDRSSSWPTSTYSSSPSFSRDGSISRSDAFGNAYDADSSATQLYENSRGRPMGGSHMGNSYGMRADGSTGRFDTSSNMYASSSLNGGGSRYSSNNGISGRGGSNAMDSSSYNRRPDGSTGRFDMSGNKYDSDEDNQRYGYSNGIIGRGGSSMGGGSMSGSRYNERPNGSTAQFGTSGNTFEWDNDMYRGSTISKTKKSNSFSPSFSIGINDVDNNDVSAQYVSSESVGGSYTNNYNGNNFRRRRVSNEENNIMKTKQKLLERATRRQEELLHQQEKLAAERERLRELYEQNQIFMGVVDEMEDEEQRSRNQL